MKFWKSIAAIFAAALCIGAGPQGGAGGAPDYLSVNDAIFAGFPFPPTLPNKNTAAETLRSQTYNPAVRNLVLIVAGQSNCASINPTLFAPGASVDQMNLYDGAIYSVTAPPLGTSFFSGSGTGGNVAARLGKLFIDNSIFDRVIIADVCVYSTLAANWATGTISDRIPQVIKRFIAKGFVPGSTNLTFAISWWQGETDNTLATAGASYTASIQTIWSNAAAAGFNCATCRMFVNTETWSGGVTSATIQSAQANAVNGTTIFAGGNTDTLNAANRQADNIHFNDTGAAAAALLVYNATYAGGAPF